MRAFSLFALCLSLAAGAVDRPSYLGPKPKARPERLVTLAPSLTEAVLALGAGKRLVGVSRYDASPEVAALPRAGGFLDPSVEAVVGLKPDLLLVQPSPGNKKAVETLARLGVPVLVLPMHSVAETLAALRELGRALGATAAAEALVRALEQTRAQVRAQTEGLPPVRVLLVYGFEPLVVAGPGSFAHELLTDAGGVNVAADASGAYPVYSVERALRSRVEVVVDATETGRGAEKLKALPGLREARWVRPPSLDLLHPGPSLGRGLVDLHRLLHPSTR